MLIVSTNSSVGQELVFKATHYNSESIGLSHNTVLNMTQDSRGFLWLSTMDGLNRFDGRTMKVYNHDPEDSTTLSDNFIHGLYETSDKLLWVATRDGGLNQLDPVTDSIQRITHSDSEEYSIPNAPVNVLYEDQTGFFWVGFFTGSLGHYDSANDSYFAMNLKVLVTDEEVNSINSVLELSDGSFLCSSLNGIYFIPIEEIEKFRSNPQSFSTVYATKIPLTVQDASPNTSNVFVDELGQVWVEKVGVSFIRIDEELIPENVLESISSGVYDTSHPNNVIERNESLFRGGEGGSLGIIDKQSGMTKPAIFSGLDPGIGLMLFQDSDQQLWGYTWGNGFYFLEEQKGITTFTQSDGLPSNFILGFDDYEDETWIATNAGLALKIGNDIQSLKGRISGYTDNSIWSLERDDLGLWLATRHDGVFFISEESISNRTFTASRFTTDNSLLLNDNTHQVYRDSRGWLWLAYQGEGVQIIKNPQGWIKGELVEIQELRKTTSELAINSNSIRKIYEDKNGNVWVATTDNGFNLISITDKAITSIRTFEPGDDLNTSLSHRDGRSVYQQNDSTFWFASYGGGLTRWISTTDRLRNFTISDGLANNSVYGVLGDIDEDYIWASTNGGLSKLDTKTLQFTTYTEVDGLQNNEFNTGAYHAKKDGSLLFGGVGGFSEIEPSLLSADTTHAPLFLTQINLFNGVMESDTSSLYLKELRLPYDQNFLSFEFAALEFGDPESVEYAHKLAGVDEDWVYSGNRNFADYPNLNPGTYTMMVKATNSDGVWSDDVYSMAVVISPPWWATVWFRLFSAVIIISLFGSVIRYYSQRKLKDQIRKMEMEHKLRSERERISRDLHDHVGSQLANIISGLSLVDKYNQVDQKEKSEDLMKSLQGDAKVTIKQLRETIWALNQNELYISEFGTHLTKYFNSQSALSAELDVQIQVIVDEDHQLSSTQALNLFRIVQEAAQNTLKYAKASALEVKLEKQNGSLCLQIKDNGTFQKLESEFNGGYGMKNMQKRAKEIQGEFSVTTNNGTEVKVNIPLEH